MTRSATAWWFRDYPCALEQGGALMITRRAYGGDRVERMRKPLHGSFRDLQVPRARRSITVVTTQRPLCVISVSFC